MVSDLNLTILRKLVELLYQGWAFVDKKDAAGLSSALKKYEIDGVVMLDAVEKPMGSNSPAVQEDSQLSNAALFDRLLMEYRANQTQQAPTAQLQNDEPMQSDEMVEVIPYYDDGDSDDSNEDNGADNFFDDPVF